MLCLLAIYLFLLAILSYYTAKKDIMSPTFIISVLFLFCNLFAIVGNFKWKVQINPELLLVFIVGMSSLYLGELFVLSSFKSRTVSGSKKRYKSNRIDISYGRMFIIIIICVTLLFLYYHRLVQVASSIGYSGTMLLKYVRIAHTTYNIELGLFYTIFLGVITASSYICVYIITYNIFVAKTSPFLMRNIIYIIPIAIQVISNILSGGREGLIRLIVVIFGCALVQYQRKIERIKMGKILLVGSISIGVFLIIFANLGKLTGKTTVDNFTDVIMIYVGSSIVALSCWLEKGLIGSSEIFAGEAFWGARHLLNMFFPSIKDKSKFLEFVQFPGGGRTNIYTAFRSYLFDFGWIGLFLVMFLIGVVFNVCYRIVKRMQNPFITILYAYFLNYYIYMLFTPSITSSLFTSSQMFLIFWLYTLYRFLLKSKINFKFGNKVWK